MINHQSTCTGPSRRSDRCDTVYRGRRSNVRHSRIGLWHHENIPREDIVHTARSVSTVDLPPIPVVALPRLSPLRKVRLDCLRDRVDRTVRMGVQGCMARALDRNRYEELCCRNRHRMPLALDLPPNGPHCTPVAEAVGNTRRNLATVVGGLVGRNPEVWGDLIPFSCVSL